jgi:hypothetical protein
MDRTTHALHSACRRLRRVFASALLPMAVLACATPLVAESYGLLPQKRISSVGATRTGISRTVEAAGATDRPRGLADKLMFWRRRDEQSSELSSPPPTESETSRPRRAAAPAPEARGIQKSIPTFQSLSGARPTTPRADPPRLAPAASAAPLPFPAVAADAPVRSTSSATRGIAPTAESSASPVPPAPIGVEDAQFLPPRIPGAVRDPLVRTASAESVTVVEPEPASEPPARFPPPAPLPAEELPDAPSAEDPIELTIPLANGGPEGKFNYSVHNDRISLVVRDVPINIVLGLIAQQHDLSVVTAADVVGVISVTLKDVTLQAALDALLGANGYTWTQRDQIIVVTSLAAGSASPSFQGRQLRVFDLNFVSAVDVEPVINGLLSPVGKAFVTSSGPAGIASAETGGSPRRIREQLIVEDLPDYLTRVEQYLAQADQPPRQVLIEAYVFQVDLENEARHGVNINELMATIDGTDITVRTEGFADPNASPAFFLGLEGSDLDLLIEAIQLTTDSKTLASPKLLVVNGQEARIQIGAQLGFLVTTTTQTSTLQQVEFLDVGVVLRVTPVITDDGRVLMTVKPEVSTGEVNAVTGLPQEETTELETTVILADGKGMVVGGLLQETDTEEQQKIPILGDLWLMGRMFQRRTVVRSRSEIIVALVPRIVPYEPCYAAGEDGELLRATSHIVGPHLERIDRRPDEPELPDAVRNPRSIAVERIPHFIPNLAEPYPHSVDYYFPSLEGGAKLRGPAPRDPTVQGGHLEDSLLAPDSVWPEYMPSAAPW